MAKGAAVENRYLALIERIFLNHFKLGINRFEFDRDEIISVSKTLRIDVPKNLGDVIYNLRYRSAMPCNAVVFCERFLPLLQHGWNEPTREILCPALHRRIINERAQQLMS